MFCTQLTLLALSVVPQQVVGTPAGPADSVCVSRIRDQARPGQLDACLQASSEPLKGVLFPYPGTNNLFSGAAVIAGGENNTAGSHGFVGGGASNRATGNYATVAGGRNHQALGNYTSVGGGSGHSALGAGSTIGGGLGNTAATNSTVAGGFGNDATGTFSCVGGGFLNEASGYFGATFGGGYNEAGGYASVTVGGVRNLASRPFSFAAGRRARAVHDGSFVWADGTDMDRSSSARDEFNVYAEGGVRMFSSSSGASGVRLAPGAGSWSSVSDRDAKDEVQPVDAEQILALVANLPITTWSYRTQGPEVRHMGPMAQDFHAAFALGTGETTIDTIDADGVALAAIQGLNARLDARDKEIAELRAELETLRALVHSRGSD